MIKNNAKRLVKISFLSLFLLVPFINVSAATVSDVSAAYGYQYYDSNNTFHNYQWFGTYSSNNLTKYNYDLPTTYEGLGVQLVDFGIRFHINGNYKAGTNYTINFTWANYNGLDDVFLANFSHLVWYSKCRVSSWSSTAQVESYCYNDYNLSFTRGSLDTEVNVTFSFNAKVDFYGFSLYFYHDNDPYEYFYSDGWEIINVSYSETTDSSQAIINNQNQNTQNIINNQNSNTNSIINNQNQNTQNIINNQNQNTQAIIDSNTTCTLYDKTSTKISGYLNTNGVINSSTSTVYGISDYLPINNNSTIYIVTTIAQDLGTCFYDNSKTLISCVNPRNLSENSTLTIPLLARYVRFSINKLQNKPIYKICKNSSESVSDTLTDSTPPDSSPIANATGWLPPGPVDSILNLPLTLMNSISNVISSGTCQPITVDLPHISNTPLVIPCMSTVWENIGLSTFFAWFGRILGGIILYRYLVRLYKWVDDTLTMRENNNFDDGSMG